jgi:hypothetical protein
MRKVEDGGDDTQTENGIEFDWEVSRAITLDNASEAHFDGAESI